uniref:Uncharacterized protein n=1 Tax=Acrobeloides nanus TaxID=290746 RepID=A0A914E630_9BILA
MEDVKDKIDVPHMPMATSTSSHSPTKTYYPLDIVVNKINTVAAIQDSDDSDQEDTTINIVNETLKKQGFEVIERDGGADCVYMNGEGPPSGPLSPELGGGTKKVSVKFKKGHRRAWSMPSGNRDKGILVVADDAIKKEGNREKHVVRYRMHPYKKTPKTTDAVNTFIEATKNDFEFVDDDDGLPDDLEVTINEEEFGCFPDFSTTSGPRGVFHKFWSTSWKVQNFELLPDWLQDNEFLRRGHRPPLFSFGSCFKSIFQLHTETGNIWTHMYGCVAFMGVAAWFLTRPGSLIAWQEKIVFSFFFLGAIICLGMSFAFHTVSCHSESVGRLFSKLDYAGITTLIVGSFIPWIYYGFYCRILAKVIYISMICILGLAALIVSLWDKFATPTFRPLRAGVFVAMGLSSIVPALHLLYTDGIHSLFEESSLHWLLIMGSLYIGGAAIYATRFPERCFPGRCDIWFQSHQLFHMFVIVAAFVHFHGITEMVMNILEKGSCREQLTEAYGTDEPQFEIEAYLNKYFLPY